MNSHQVLFSISRIFLKKFHEKVSFLDLKLSGDFSPRNKKCTKTTSSTPIRSTPKRKSISREKSLTMGELKKQLADLGLKTTGKKQILLDRLKEHHESNQKWDDSFEIFQKKSQAQ